MYWLPMVVRSWRGLKAGLKLMGRMMAARLRGSRWVTGGAALQGRMLEAALASGVDIRVARPVSSLVEKNGRICGVVMTIGERQFTLGARIGEIGRASCRERVCQYVWISLVAASLKKQTQSNQIYN